jgi:hypothetical protein
VKRRRARPWTLAKVFGSSPTALAVWCALCELSDARRSPVVTPTRDELARAVGIARHKTISATLTLLEVAGWIDRAHVPVTTNGARTATLLRIVLRRRGRSSAPYGARRRRGRSSAPRVKGAPAPQDFSQKRRAREPVAPSAVGVGATPAGALCAHQDCEGDGPLVDIADALGLVKGASHAAD